MKKLICLLLALVMALSLAACGGEGEVSGKVDPNQEAAPATVPAGKVAFQQLAFQHTS